MKISSLIVLLKQRLDQHGDHEVYLAFPPNDPDGQSEIENVQSHHLHMLNHQPMVTCISGIDPADKE